MQLNFSENRNKQCNQSKYVLQKHKDNVEIFLLLADVTVLECFFFLSSLVSNRIQQKTE